MNDEPVGYNKLRPTRGCNAPIIAEISATGTKPQKWAKQRRRNENMSQEGKYVYTQPSERMETSRERML